jgi:hypothetical protein
MSMYWIWSRPWCADISDSLRVSVHLTGLPRRRATRRLSTSSGVTCSLPPKPPPTSGAITRSLCSGTPVIIASITRRMCGTCVEDQRV